MSKQTIPFPLRVARPLPHRRAAIEKAIAHRRRRLGAVAFIHAPIGAHAACGMIRAIVAEMAAVVLGEDPTDFTRSATARRRSAVHQRQIAMYVTHVVLSMSLTDIGIAYGRDRTTVGHACHVVEDRRDDPAYDRFVTAIERLVLAVFNGESLRHAH